MPLRGSTERRSAGNPYCQLQSRAAPDICARAQSREAGNVRSPTRCVRHPAKQGAPAMPTSTAQPGFHEAEIPETLHSLVGILEDTDFSNRAYAYTEDATLSCSGLLRSMVAKRCFVALKPARCCPRSRSRRTRSKATAV